MEQLGLFFSLGMKLLNPLEENQLLDSASIRVLYLLDHLHTARAGTEQHLCWLLANLPETVKRRFAVLSHVNCGTDDWPVKPIVVSRHFGKGPLFWPRRVLAVAEMIKSQRIDIVHAMCPMSELVAIMTRLIGCRSAIIGSRRNVGYSLNRRIALRSRMLQVFDLKYVANSEAAKAVARTREGIPGERITVIPNPIPLRRIEEGVRNCPPRSALCADGDLLVAMVATVRTIKDYPTFIRAARLVCDTLPNVHFLAIGEHGDVYPDLAAMTRDLGLEGRFTWLGAVDNPFTVLPHVDVAVLTSLSESFSNSVLEYAAAGKPAVVTDVGSLREIVVDGLTGFVVPPAKPEVVASRILDILTDPVLRRQFGEAAQEHVRSRFSEDIVRKAYMDLYLDMAGNTIIDHGG